MNKKSYLEADWYFQGFHAAPNFIHHGPTTSVAMMFSEVGISYERNMFVYNEGYLEYGYPVDGLNAVGQFLLEKQKTDKNYIQKLIEKQQKYIESSKQFFKSFKKEEDLFGLYHQAFKAYCDTCLINHTVEGFSYVTESILKKKLFEYLKGKPKDLKQYLSTLFQPVRPSFANEENIDLLEIQLLMEQGKDVEERLIEHSNKFFWINNNYFRTKVLTADDFRDELNALLKERGDTEKLIEDAKNLYIKNAENKKKALDELDADKEFRELIHLSELFMHWQDDRKMYILTAVHYVSEVLKMIAEKFDVDFELAKWLIAEEIKEETFTNFPQKDLMERSKSSVWFFGRDGDKLVTEVIVGDEAEAAKKIISSRRKSKEVNELTGTCASPGKAIGKAKICRTLGDFAKFEDGDVLVCAMTRPEFVPIMKKSVGIITDEGGITSHAAIISRELGIPCVIGTGNATTTLKDNDLVEVNADHNRVKIIK